MFDNTQQNCAFAEQTISYLYNEIDVSSKAAFEKHLATCAVCADEITGFGSVRSSIQGWQREEFFLLETPQIEFPNKENEKLPLVISVSNKNKSWIDELRKIFTVSPGWAMAAALLLVTIFAGLIVVKRNLSGNNQMAEIDGIREVQQQDVSSKVENNPEIALETDSNKSVNSNLPEKPVYQNAAKIKEQLPKNLQMAENRQIIKVSGNRRAAPKIESAAKYTNNLPVVHKLDNSSYVAIKMPSASAKQTPKLNNIEEDEEETLRLADLLDEVSGK